MWCGVVDRCHLCTVCICVRAWVVRVDVDGCEGWRV